MPSCPDCGAGMAPDDTVCVECGATVDRTSVARRVTETDWTEQLQRTARQVRADLALPRDLATWRRSALAAAWLLAVPSVLILMALPKTLLTLPQFVAETVLPDDARERPVVAAAGSLLRGLGHVLVFLAVYVVWGGFFLVLLFW